MFGKSDKEISALKRRINELESIIELQGTKVFEVTKRFDMLSQLFDEVIESSGTRIRSLQNTINKLKKKDDEIDLNTGVKKVLVKKIAGILGEGE